MSRVRSSGAWAWTCVVVLGAVAAVAARLAAGEQSSAAQPARPQPTAAAPPATATAQASESPAGSPVAETAKAEKKEPRGRLPAYYSRVVDQTQREKIYAIQREYAPKIEALRAQLEALIADRDQKITAVLTPDQLKTVERLKAEAKSKRDQAPAGKSTTQ